MWSGRPVSLGAMKSASERQGSLPSQEDLQCHDEPRALHSGGEDYSYFTGGSVSPCGLEDYVVYTTQRFWVRMSKVDGLEDFFIRVYPEFIRDRN